jgi:endonuclease YncB( thermonuclease family)
MLRVMILLALSAALGAGRTPAERREWAGRVVAIQDGDSIEVLRGRETVKIRLYGVDCPESRQAFGNRAKQRTSELAFGKTVTVVERTHDRYQRTVAEIILPSGANLSHELLRSGLAWWFRKYAPRDATLRDLEQDAHDRQLGLWSDHHPIPPWEWRKTPSRDPARATIAP